MTHPLGRLLRLRALMEETARAELERHIALVAKIDWAQKREELRISESRRNVVKQIGEDDAAEAQAKLRAEEWVEAMLARRRELALKPLAETALRRVTESQVEFLERRTERRQVETVLKEAQARLAEERERRAQRELDDWFSGRMLRRRRGPSSARLF